MSDLQRSIGRALMRGRALGRVAALVSALAVFGVWMYFQDHSDVVHTEQTTATVIEAREAGLHVRVASGETVWISAPPGILFGAGAVIPLVIETQESGARTAYFDRKRWMKGGHP